MSIAFFFFKPVLGSEYWHTTSPNFIVVSSAFFNHWFRLIKQQGCQNAYFWSNSRKLQLKKNVYLFSKKQIWQNNHLVNLSCFKHLFFSKLQSKPLNKFKTVNVFWAILQDQLSKFKPHVIQYRFAHWSIYLPQTASVPIWQTYNNL